MIPFSQGIAYLHLNLHELPCIHTVMNQSYNLNEFNHFFLNCYFKCSDEWKRWSSLMTYEYCVIKLRGRLGDIQEGGGIKNKIYYGFPIKTYKLYMSLAYPWRGISYNSFQYEFLIRQISASIWPLQIEVLQLELFLIYMIRRIRWPLDSFFW